MRQKLHIASTGNGWGNRHDIADKNLNDHITPHFTTGLWNPKPETLDPDDPEQSPIHPEA